MNENEKENKEVSLECLIPPEGIELVKGGEKKPESSTESVSNTDEQEDADKK